MKLLFRVLMTFLMLASLAACGNISALMSEEAETYPLSQWQSFKQREVIADQLAAAGKAEMAIPIYRNLIRDMPLEVKEDLLLKLGTAQYGAGAYPEALLSFDQASAGEVSLCAVNMGAGKALFAMGQVSRAVVRYELCLKHDPQNAEAEEGWAMAKMMAVNDEAAFQILQNRALNHPSDICRQNNYALALILKGEFQKSRQHLEKYAYSVDSAYVVRQNLALVTALMGDDGGARYIALMDLPPEQAESNVAIYRRLRQSGQMAGLKSLLLGVEEVQ